MQNGMTFGGTDTFVLNLCRSLVKDGYETTVILSRDNDREEPQETELRNTGVSIIKTCSLGGNPVNRLKHLLMLYLVLIRGKFDVFQANIDLFNGPQLFVAWLAMVPVRVCHSHNSQQGRELQKGKTLAVRLYQKIMRWMCWTFSNRRCGCSGQAMNFLFQEKWKQDAKSRIIHNGIDLRKFQAACEREKIKQALGFEGRYNICTIGRIDFQKNPEFLLEVFAELAKTRTDVDLIWCGRGREEERVRESVRHYGLEQRVHLLGTRKDIPDILQCSDLFLLPSRFEGLGIVLVEAQAANLPCVVSEAIPEEADCGLCVSLPVSDGAAVWAKKIDDILNGCIRPAVDRDKLHEFSIEHMVKEMEEVFEG